MAQARFASVAIDSPLPQLDRLFDYRIPEALAEQVLEGVRVTVPFGKNEAPQDGFVVSVSSSTDYIGELNEIQSVISAVQVLPARHYKLLRAVADRQAGTLGEVLKLAVPKRSVRVEKAWLSRSTGVFQAAEVPDLDFPGRPFDYLGRQTIIAEPRLVDVSVGTATVKVQAWIAHLLAFGLAQLKNGRSAILVVPDFRDQNRLKAAAETLGLKAKLVDFSTDQTNAVRYASYLSCLEQIPSIVIGSRAAIWAPLQELGGIAIFDDTDQSLIEPTAPYTHIRDVALIKQQQTNCNLLLVGHTRSAEVERLRELGYLNDKTAAFAKPKIAVTEPGLRVDSTSYQLVRETLSQGKPVLVQVAATGNSVSTYCSDCSERSRCRFCNGPIFLDSSTTPKCRWCSAINLDLTCKTCGGKKLRTGGAGSARTATELGRSFPGVAVVESTYQHRIESVKPGKRLVVATPGAEPWVEGGYGAVVLLDGQRLLARDTLRATEQALALWSNAISLMASEGRCVGVGLAGPIGQKLALWQQGKLAIDEFQSRVELSFPPARRLASISGPKPLIEQIVMGLGDAISAGTSMEVLGPLMSENNPANLSAPVWRYLLRYEYALGESLAKELKTRALKVNASNRAVNAKSGRASRAVRIRMDDWEVI